jgi:hypothetical protein
MVAAVRGGVEMERRAEDEAFDRYRAAKKARSRYAHPDRELERGLWQAAADVLRAHGEADEVERFPRELATDLASLLEALVHGEWPQELKVLQRRGPVLPGGQKARYIEDAIRFITACEQDIISEMTIDQAIEEVMYEYEVSAATVRDWLEGCRVDSPPDDVPADLAEEAPAARLDALMRRSGYYFRIWPRLP